MSTPDHDAERYDDLAGRLRSVGEEMTELGIDLLRDAVESERGRRPPGEKFLARSRTAVEKAASLLDKASEATRAESND